MNEQRGENFHNELKIMEIRFKNNHKSMLVDYCWLKNIGNDFTGRKPACTNFF